MIDSESTFGGGDEVVSPAEQVAKHPWYALWVRSRHEEKVADRLRQKGYETFLPLSRSRRRWSDRYREVDVPLLPGYVFRRFDPNDHFPVSTTPGLVRVVGCGRMPEPVDEIEMQSLITAVASGSQVQLWPFLKPGQRVTIEEGPLRSLEGVLLTVKGQDHLILSLSLLQRSVAVSVERCWVRPVGERLSAIRVPGLAVRSY